MPGVVAVFHAGNDLGMPAMQGFAMLPPAFNRPIFASERVRFVGDVIAAVVAESQAQANDAAGTVVADIDPLPSVMNAADGLKDDAPLLFPETGSNVCFATEFGKDGGDPCEGADAIAEVTMVSQRLAGVPMENNGVVAVPNGDGVTMWLSHQAPHSVHGAYAPMLGLEPGQLRIVCPWVGGGFGPKAAGYVEHLIAAKAALMLGKPVKWVESRSEDMVSLVHGRDYVMTARLGVNNDGTIVGLDSQVLASAGAYPAIGAILPMLTQMMSVGVYEIPKVRFDAKTVMTNNTTVGAYRGAGRPEATQLIERVLDVAADQIGIDPAEIRRRNFMQPDTFPRTTITGANYDSGEYTRALDAALAASGYDDLRAEQAARRATGDTKQIGIGVSSYVEVTAPVGLHVEWGACEVNPDGSATVFAGTSVHGQGHLTAFAMLASDVLGIPMDKITLVNSDTRECRAVPARSGRGRCRPPAARSTSRRRACSSGRRRSPPTCWRHRPTTSSSATAACRWPVCHPTPCRGLSSRPRRATRPSSPRTSSRARSATSSTSTALIRHSRSARTSRWSRSTPRPVASRCCGTSPSTTAVASSTRCWFGASSTVASGKARHRRSTSRWCTTPMATRSPRTWRTTQSRRPPSSAASRRRTPRPTAHAIRLGEGHRRVGHDRIHAGDSERGRRRRLPSRCHPHRHAVHGRASVERDQQRSVKRFRRSPCSTRPNVLCLRKSVAQPARCVSSTPVVRSIFASSVRSRTKASSSVRSSSS